jgi:HSP20 family protein
VDVYEDEHNVTLKIEVPGIDEKDIDVRIENNTLTVHGERKFEKEEKEENYPPRGAPVWQLHPHLHSPEHGRPGAAFRPTTTRACLKIKLAKKAEAKPKQIKVNVGGAKTLEAKAARKLRKSGSRKGLDT